MTKSRTSTRRKSGTGRWDRSVPTELRREEQRTRILEAATRVIASRGLSKTTVQHVLDESAVGRRSFYEHFDDLTSLVLALASEAGQNAFGAVEAAASKAPDPIARLQIAVDSFLGLVAANQDLARVMFVEIRVLGPEHEIRHEAMLQRFSALLMEGVAKAYAEGIVTRPPDELTVFALVSAVESVALRYVHRREGHRAPEAAPALIELIVRAFR